MEAAEFLAEQGKQVTVVEMLERVGHNMGTHSRRVLLHRLRQMDIILAAKTSALEITYDGGNGQQQWASTRYPDR